MFLYISIWGLRTVGDSINKSALYSSLEPLPLVTILVPNRHDWSLPTRSTAIASHRRYTVSLGTMHNQQHTAILPFRRAPYLYETWKAQRSRQSWHISNTAAIAGRIAIFSALVAHSFMSKLSNKRSWLHSASKNLFRVVDRNCHITRLI
jgi:hypothetical protein